MAKKTIRDQHKKGPKTADVTIAPQQGSRQGLSAQSNGTTACTIPSEVAREAFNCLGAMARDRSLYDHLLKTKLPSEICALDIVEFREALWASLEDSFEQSKDDDRVSTPSKPARFSFDEIDTFLAYSRLVHALYKENCLGDRMVHVTFQNAADAFKRKIEDAADSCTPEDAIAWCGAAEAGPFGCEDLGRAFEKMIRMSLSGRLEGQGAALDWIRFVGHRVRGNTEIPCWVQRCFRDIRLCVPEGSVDDQNKVDADVKDRIVVWLETAFDKILEAATKTMEETASDKKKKDTDIECFTSWTDTVCGLREKWQQWDILE